MCKLKYVLDVAGKVSCRVLLDHLIRGYVASYNHCGILDQAQPWFVKKKTGTVATISIHLFRYWWC